jgi:OTU domain-containing protein 6
LVASICINDVFPQARKAAALAQSYSPDDPVAQARLEKEAKDEEEAITRICNKLGVAMHEVRYFLG